MTRVSESARERQGTWVLLACAVAFALSAALALGYLLWTFVPYHARHLEELPAAVPRATAYALLMANWFVRLLPLLVLFFIPAAGLAVVLGIVAVALFKVSLYKVLRAVAVAALVVGLSEAAACAFVVYAILAAY